MKLVIALRSGVGSGVIEGECCDDGDGKATAWQAASMAISAAAKRVASARAPW